jgi:hypothetical protein
MPKISLSGIRRYALGSVSDAVNIKLTHYQSDLLIAFNPYKNYHLEVFQFGKQKFVQRDDSERISPHRPEAGWRG